MGSVRKGVLARGLLSVFVAVCVWVLAGGLARAQARFPKIPKSSGKPEQRTQPTKPEAKSPAPSGAVAGAEQAQEGGLTVLVTKEYPWDMPLQTEFSINGQTVNIYTAATSDPIARYLKSGWNSITVKTTAQEPANKNNQLIFRIGPAQEDPKGKKMVVSPVLWEFRNGTDWRFKDGKFSHPLGPDVKEVTLSYAVYYTDPQGENASLKAGDFVLKSKGQYGTAWNSPVTATVFVNGTPLNTFMIAPRQVVITSLLKQGKNEIKLVSTRVKNAIRGNDIEFEVAGPAEWMVAKGEYVLARVVQFGSMQGWTQDAKTGMLINRAAPNSETIERVIPFFLKEASKETGQ